LSGHQLLTRLHNSPQVQLLLLLLPALLLLLG
jgi:hypothetical protein